MLLIPVLVIVSLRSLAGLERRRRIAAIVLRSALIALVAAILARVQTVRTTDDLAVMFVLDKSRSIPETDRIRAQEYVLTSAREAPMDDRVGVLGFDGTTDIDMIPSRGGADSFAFSMASEPDRTDMASAVRLAIAALPKGFSRRIVLITDGHQNVGDVVDEIETARANDIAVDVLPITYTHENEILFDRLVVPPNASKDTTIPLRLVVKSRQHTRAKVTLYKNDEEIPLPQDIYELEGGMKPSVIRVPVQIGGGGVHRFDARVTPVDPADDSVIENNIATGFTFVDDRGKVLLLAQEGNAAEEEALAQALGRENVDVELRSTDQIDLDLLKLQEYAVVILANVAADMFTQEQHEALRTYVSNFGGGLIMTGGDRSFGAGGWIGKPVEEVSPVAFDIKHKKVIPRGALVIIMHSCEIARGNYWGEQVAIAAVKTISSRDYLGVVCYNPRMGGPNWDVPLALATDKSAIINKIKNMTIGDMPSFQTTMTSAMNNLMALKGVSQRHMIIISDGDPAEPTQMLLDQMKKNRITCSTVGIGWGAHVEGPPMNRIATATGGKYYPCRNPRRLPQIFIKESKVLRRQLIDEQAFKPQQASFFAPTMLGIGEGELPPLGGLVLTEPKAEIIMPLVRANKDERDDPLLAHWNYEMGKMAVFTSGWWPKWGTEWAGWEKFGKFWAQVVRWCMRQPGSADFDVVTRLEGNKGRILIEALQKDASFMNFLRIGGFLTTPAMQRKPLQLSQVGPGQYEATFDVDEDGNYLVDLSYLNPDGEKGLLRTGLSVPYSPEFREMNTNMPLLKNIVERSGGRMLTLDAEGNPPFDKEAMKPATAEKPAWRWALAWLLLPIFLLDIANRRLASSLAMSVYAEIAIIAFFVALLYTMKAPLYAYIIWLLVAHMIGWAIRYRYIMPTLDYLTAGTAALSRAGQRSSESLGHLKGVRERVRGEFDQEGEQQTKRQKGVDLEGGGKASARFEISEDQAREPVEDLTSSVGGAEAEDTGKAGDSGGKTGDKDAKSQDETTSRLLRAKRRARGKMKEDDTE
jgi:uncharacterized membrane protein